MIRTKMTAPTVSLLIATFLLFSVFTMSVSAVKPTSNDASALKIPWNLSAAVMKVPPYGSGDILGSDTASKLIVNQPNGITEVTITGAMNGLHPNTVYTVYLSKAYTTTFERWNLMGNWKLDFLYGSGHYRHEMTITTETDTAFAGTGKYPAGGPYTITWTVTGTKTGSGVTLTMWIDYDGSSYLVTAIGNIDPTDGSIQGTWSSNAGQSGTWSSYEGAAVHQGSVGTGWPGLFTGTIPSFTFTTDAYGAGSWHINMQDANFFGAGTYSLSVWINEAGRTILISDTFSVTV